MSQINVNNIVGKNGASAVTFPHGINVTGVVTATTLNQNVVGVVTATTFDGNLTGNVTGNVTGNTSGSAGSLAAGATGADLTLSGNLTVNGTTTTIDTAVTSVDSLAVDGNGTFGSIDVSSTSTDGVRALGGSGQLVVQRSSGASGRAIEIYDGSSRTIDIFANGNVTFAGTVSDSMGPLRRLGINAQTGAYTVTTTDAGKLIRVSNTGNITIPTGLNPGDMVSIVSHHASTNTIVQDSGLTLYNTADGSTGNRTLAARGVCTILWSHTDTAYISGSGLS